MHCAEATFSVFMESDDALPGSHRSKLIPMPKRYSPLTLIRHLGGIEKARRY